MRVQLLVLCAGASAARVNPIQKVMELLGDLSTKISGLGSEAQNEYEEFSQWCKERSKEIMYAVETKTTKLDNTQAVLDKSASDISESSTKIEELSGSISSAEAQLKRGRSVRADQRKSFVEEEKELRQTVSTLERTREVLKAKSFLQTPDSKKVTDALEAVLMASSVDIEGRTKLLALTQDDDVYERKSGSVVELIEDMLDKAVDHLNERRKKETEDGYNFKLLEQSLTDQIKAQNRELDEQKKLKASAEETQAKAQGVKTTTTAARNADNADLKKLHYDCMTRASNFEKEQTERAAELKVIAQAKKVIQESTGGAEKRQYDEEAPSFLQMWSRGIPQDVISIIQRTSRATGATELAQLTSAIRAASVLGANPFGKVKKLIGDMLTKLEKEMNKAAEHKAFCDKEMSESRKKKDTGATRIEDLNARQDKAQSAIASLKQDIAEANKELRENAQSQGEMQKMRTRENEIFKEARADYNQGLLGIGTALKILREYYAKDDAESLVQKDGESASSGIIGLLEVTESDFSKSLAEIQTDEDEAVEKFEQELEKHKISFAKLEEEVKEKSQSVMRTKNVLSDVLADKDSEQSELDAVLEYYGKLKEKCVSRPEPYEERRKRREAEIEGLRTALETLEGSSFLSVRQS